MTELNSPCRIYCVVITSASCSLAALHLQVCFCGCAAWNCPIRLCHVPCGERCWLCGHALPGGPQLVHVCGQSDLDHQHVQREAGGQSKRAVSRCGVSLADVFVGRCGFVCWCAQLVVVGGATVAQQQAVALVLLYAVIVPPGTALCMFTYVCLHTCVRSYV